jgi:O-Antigen ligase
MKINKYWPIVFVYFFLNSAGLPWGLLYTTILSPLLYYWVVKTRRKDIMIPFLAVITPFVICQLLTGVEFGKYIVSLLNIAAVYVFAQATYTFLITCEDKEKLFRRILYTNFALCLIAIPFYSSPYFDVFWISQAYTENVSNFLRLRMFTYEASYYAVLFTPIFLFYFYQVILRQNKINTLVLAVLLLTPYILSLSIGVLICLLLACVLVYLIYARPLTQRSRMLYLLLFGSLLAVFGMICLFIFAPNNAVVVRLENIFTGHDISSQGRTSDAFVLAERILDRKNPWWGIGPGQLKKVGADIIRAWYNYQPDFDIITIPNATAETLVIFGWLGLALRLIIEIVLFRYTKVWKNYFRLALFLFIFLYQFTGSFITSTAEYVIWILAFTNAFPQFDVIRPTPVKNKKIPVLA